VVFGRSFQPTGDAIVAALNKRPGHPFEWVFPCRRYRESRPSFSTVRSIEAEALTILIERIVGSY
jgi:hypothetical protein